jgi:acyl-CoA thioesterase
MTATHPDTFAALLGIGMTRIGDGRTEASLTIGAHHLNPHGTAHGAVIYSVGGVALAAAANDEEHSGVVTAVHIDYLRPARMGDRLLARAELAERLEREDLFVVRVTKGEQQELVARLSGRATRRVRAHARPAAKPAT